MKIIGIIPARYSSSRFPGKPLVDIAGKTMIQRVYEQAKKSSLLTEVIVATDDERIYKAVKSFGGQVSMTSADHPSGTDRCYEVVRQLHESGVHVDVLVNIQGDEPFIHPGQIDLICTCFENNETKIATLAKKIEESNELFSTSINKVIIDQDGQAIYFSRTPIPYIQNSNPDEWVKLFPYYKHIGIYGYRASVLGEITRLKPTQLELAESLEQLRWIDHGYSIKVELTEYESIAIDTPDDLLKITNMS